MDRQDIFKRVVRNLRAQGRRAVKVDKIGKERCCYRAPDGCKCAIGGLIPDELYDPQMDNLNGSFLGMGVRDVLLTVPALVALWGVEGDLDIQFLQDLQFMHDKASDLEAAFVNFAAAHALVLA